MKILIGLLAVAFVASNAVLALPARSPNDDAELIDVPRIGGASIGSGDANDTDFKNFKGVIDTGVGYPFLQPRPHSFFNFGFFDAFDDILRRLRARLWPVELRGASGEEGGSGESILSFGFDPKKGNTTSTVKVVDGHKVEVNETVYGDKNSLFKMRVVNIRPLEEGETVEETVLTSTGSQGHPGVQPVTSAPKLTSNRNNEANVDDSNERREPLERKSNDNEIHGNIDDPEQQEQHSKQTEDSAMLPTRNEDNDGAANLNAAFVADNGLEELNTNGNGSDEFETNQPDNDGSDAIEYNDDAEVGDNPNESLSSSSSSTSSPAATAAATADGEEREQVEELTKDVDEFELSGASDDEVDSGVIADNTKAKYPNHVRHKKPREDESSSDDEGANESERLEMPPQFDSEWGSLAEDLANAKNNENNDLSNDIDAYEVVPVDLSNDIAVNDIAAAAVGEGDLPLDPDVELIDVYGVPQHHRFRPRFEKLSVAHPTHYQSSSYSHNMK